LSKIYTYNAWHDTFKPIKNTITKYPNVIHFETYGEEYEFVQRADNKYIWTEVDGEDGTYIVAGWHYVNRIHYYITEKPWEDEMTEVPTWLSRQCDCCEETENGEYHPMCGECEEGYIDIPTDTVNDLIAIYGKDADIVG
jgi:hypothetical protein